MFLSAIAISLLAIPKGEVSLARDVAPPEIFRSWKVLYLAGKDIWTCNGDGSGKKRIVTYAQTPCWSPDKKRLAFSRGAELWVANADGSGAKRLCKVDRGQSSNIGWITWGSRAMEGRKLFPLNTTHNKVLDGPAIVFAVQIGNSSSPYQYVFSHPKLGAQELGFLQSGTPYKFSHYEFPSLSRDSHRLALAVNGDVWVAEETDDPKKSIDFSGGWDITRAFAAASFDAPSYRVSRENYVTEVVSWSPNGKLLAFGVVRAGGSGKSDIGILDFTNWNFMRGETDLKPRWLSHSGFAPSISPDGKWVLHEHFDLDHDHDGLAAISIDGKRIVKLRIKGRFPRW